MTGAGSYDVVQWVNSILITVFVTVDKCTSSNLKLRIFNAFDNSVSIENNRN